MSNQGQPDELANRTLLLLDHCVWMYQARQAQYRSDGKLIRGNF